MARNVKCIEVRTADGKLMFSLRLYDEFQGAGSNAKAPSGNHAARPAQASHSGNGDRDADAMTDAQKRYLFRILADQGLEGEQAFAHLKERLGVENLNNATKHEASSLIEELLGSAAAA